jgi:hypothetical protein
MGTDAHQLVQLKPDLDVRVEIKLLQINVLKFVVMDTITVKISAMMAIIWMETAVQIHALLKTAGNAQEETSLMQMCAMKYAETDSTWEWTSVTMGIQTAGTAALQLAWLNLDGSASEALLIQRTLAGKHAGMGSEI